MDLPDVINKMSMNETNIDMIPNDDLPLRILKAYRRRCDEKWSWQGVSDGSRRIYEAMNEAQDRRAAILDKAILTLEKEERK